MTHNSPEKHGFTVCMYWNIFMVGPVINSMFALFLLLSQASDNYLWNISIQSIYNLVSFKNK